MQTNRIDQPSVSANTVLHGDHSSIMRRLSANGIGFILTDPLTWFAIRTGMAGPSKMTATPTGWCRHSPKPIEFSSKID
jgi:hypothetical protein